MVADAFHSPNHVVLRRAAPKHLLFEASSRFFAPLRWAQNDVLKGHAGSPVPADAFRSPNHVVLRRVAPKHLLFEVNSRFFAPLRRAQNDNKGEGAGRLATPHLRKRFVR